MGAEAKKPSRAGVWGFYFALTLGVAVFVVTRLASDNTLWAFAAVLLYCGVGLVIAFLAVMMNAGDNVFRVLADARCERRRGNSPK